jgi:hypothetical protein
MTLEEKIRDREIVYNFQGDLAVATELALLYYIMAKRKNIREQIAEACYRAVYWLKRARVEIPEYIEQLSCYGQLDEIEKLIVEAKVNICPA